MKTFTESMRYDYPLNADSIVIDAGAHKGTFSRLILERYNCNVYAMEPVKQFHDSIAGKPFDRANFHLMNFGLGANCRNERFAVRGDSSGAFSASEQNEEVGILGIGDLLSIIDGKHPFRRIDVLKLNIEGMEFETLQQIILDNTAKRFSNIQVQFHQVVPNFVRWREGIRAALLQTHELTFDCPWVWENWRLRDISASSSAPAAA